MASLAHVLLLSCLATFFASNLQADSLNYKPKSLSGYLPRNYKKVLNTIDSCWRTESDWATNRRALADCAVGFGQAAIGGKYGKTYVVTTPDDDPINPKPGTLRYGAIRTEPLWIIFARDMVITLENELMINSYKTIDGRGANVEITGGPCLKIEHVSHVIIHGISIHDCKPGKKGLVRSSPRHVGERRGADGDAIAISASSNIWIDHCYLARCMDGLIDVIHASTAVTISNNYFTEHDKVMLLGHNDKYTEDQVMKVTVVFNHFGPKLNQRMPRVRFGYAHVANNRYDKWQMYAIGGSAGSTIFSEGNYFIAPDISYAKEVTKREVYGGWKNWKWRSSKDVFMNDAYFVQSGYGRCAPRYSKAQSFTASPGAMAPALTSDAGPLNCVVGEAC
ncbi:PREDICTED: probable pectate lyase 16 [Populus euphratica]|uniref:Pectate lyase n=1 Tax=Populus euphratica TaxID=75702 RepID=A0AAJ6VEY6_POPEU|nr:PREDICTED: probable pectate lyase 16 [Populus euphratica]